MPATAERRRGVDVGVFLISRSVLFWCANIDLADISSRPNDFYVFDEGAQEMGEPRVPALKHRAPHR